MTRALISVSDKDGIVELAQAMVGAGIEVISTGGTASHLKQHGVPVVDVTQVTSFPEVMGGRVKTLHPAVHAGILARRGDDGHAAVLSSLGFEAIDYVVVNLYPFAQTIASVDGAQIDAATEQVDIGGPTMLRAAAKNWRGVAALVDPADYQVLQNRLNERRDTVAASDIYDEDERLALAARVFRHTAAYDSIIAGHFTDASNRRPAPAVADAPVSIGPAFPESLTVTYEKRAVLRYGENPHQRAAFYADPFAGPDTIAGAVQIQGKQLSYNNIADADSALALVRELDDMPAAVVIKHANPCGAAVAPTISEAWRRAHDADPVSVFGGIVALNRPVDLQTARSLGEVFLEVVIAPHFELEALDVLRQKPNLRLLTVAMPQPPGEQGRWLLGPARQGRRHMATALDPGMPVAGVAVATQGDHIVTASVSGGLLVQQADTRQVDAGSELEIVTTIAPNEQQVADLLFAWHIVKHVKSNAIVVATGGQSLGIGAGQMNRVGAARIALEQAGDRARGAVLASDAFFPMPDTVELAAAAGIAAIIQPGGSRRDADSIVAADAAGIAMVFTAVRHFRH